MAKSKTIQWKFLKLDGVVDRRFKVSNEGEIFNVKKGILVKSHDMHKKSPFNGTDYQSVYLKGYGGLRLHRVVCETWHGTAPSDKNVVLHLDEHKNNNNKNNLKWGTLSENAQAYAQSRLDSKAGRLPRHSLTKIKRAKTLLNKGYTNDKVATMTKIGDSMISRIKLGTSHPAVEPLTNVQIALGNV